MFKWLRGLLKCQYDEKPIIVKFEVTVNVSPIHVFTSGPKEEKEQRFSAEDRSKLQSTEERTTIRDIAKTGTEQLDRVAIRSKSIPVPEVPFGEERRT